MSAARDVSPGWTWREGRDPTPAAQDIVARPGFAFAARELARVLLTTTDRDPALAAIFKDAGHYVVAMWTLYLHESGGVTMPRLKALCEESGYMSAGRSRVLLQLLQHIACVAPASARARGEPTRYVPTPLFLSSWHAHLTAVLTVLMGLDPRVGALRRRFHDPEVFATYVRIQTGRLHTLSTASAARPAFERVFMQRYAGLRLIALLVVSAPVGGFPPSGPIPIAPSEVAARFGVSRMHLRRMLRDAAAEGLIEELDDGLFPTELLRLTLTFFHAIQMAELIGSAVATLEALGLPKEEAATMPCSAAS